MKVYLKEEIPDRFHYRHNKRIQPIILVADEGWTIVQNESLSKCKCDFLMPALGGKLSCVYSNYLSVGWS